MPLRPTDTDWRERRLGVRLWYLDDVERVVEALREASESEDRVEITAGHMRADDVEDLRGARPRDLRNVQIASRGINIRLTCKDGARARAWSSSGNDRQALDRIAAVAARRFNITAFFDWPLVILLALIPIGLLLTLAVSVWDLGLGGAAAAAISLTVGLSFGCTMLAFRLWQGAAKVVPLTFAESHDRRRSTRERLRDVMVGVGATGVVAVVVERLT